MVLLTVLLRVNTGTFVGENKGGKHSPVNKISNEDNARVKHHMESIPKLNRIILAVTLVGFT